jgi:hypothetical protein
MNGDFGHYWCSGRGGHIDGWGAGPFLITAGGRQYRFEDSARFGPLLVNRDGEFCKRMWFSERHPFWAAWEAWKSQGRRVGDDGVTCLYDEEE